MTSGAGRVGVVAAALVVAVVLFAVLQDGGDDGEDGNGTTTGTTATGTTTTTQTTTEPQEPAFDVVRMRDGAPVGGVQELTYSTGDRVRIEVRLDEPQEEIHLHGYDIDRLSPAERARFEFTADIEGIFELEAHGPDGDVVLAEIRVEPS